MTPAKYEYDLLGLTHTFVTAEIPLMKNFLKVALVTHHHWYSVVWASLCNSADPDKKVHGANMGPTWALSAPDGPMLAP